MGRKFTLGGVVLRTKVHRGVAHPGGGVVVALAVKVVDAQALDVGVGGVLPAGECIGDSARGIGVDLFDAVTKFFGGAAVDGLPTFAVGHHHVVFVAAGTGVDAGTVGIAVGHAAVGLFLRDVDDLARQHGVDVGDVGVVGQNGFAEFFQGEGVAGFALQQPDVGDGAATAYGDGVAVGAVVGDVVGAVAGGGVEAGDAVYVGGADSSGWITNTEDFDFPGNGGNADDGCTEYFKAVNAASDGHPYLHHAARIIAIHRNLERHAGTSEVFKLHGPI